MSNQKKVEYLPRTQESWMSCKFGVNTVNKTGYGYTWEAKTMEELPKALQNFSYNEKFTIKEFHQYVGERYDAYAAAGKVRPAFEKLKARIKELENYLQKIKNEITEKQNNIPEVFRNEDDGFDFYYYEGVLDTIKDIERVLGATIL